MVYLAGGGVRLFTSQTITSLFSLGIAVAFANMLPKEAYGIYQYVLAMTAILAITTLAGMNVAITQATAKGTSQGFPGGFSIRAKWGLIGSAVALSIAGYYLMQGNAMLASAFAIAAIFLPFWETLGIYIAYLQGQKDFARIARYEITAHGSATLCIFIALLLTTNVVILLATYFASWTLARLFFYLRVSWREPPHKEIDPAVLSYGKHITVMSVLSTASNSLDKLLLWHVLGPTQLATYMFATLLPLRAAGYFKIINRLAFPKLSAQTSATILDTLPRKVLLFAGIGVIVALTYAVAAEWIFALLFPAYITAVPYTRIAAMLLVLQPFSLIATALYAQVKQREMYIFNIVMPLCRAGLFLIFIPTFGLVGALWALVSAKALDAIMLLYFLFAHRRRKS